MSNPENILAKFRTYSYHHVLVACENTRVAEELAKTVNMYDYLYVDNENRHTKKTISSGGYVVIANGLVDSDFIIDEVKWVSVIAPQPGKKDVEQFASFAVEGSMEISEPRGVNFLNVISTTCDTLETDPTGLVFLLKTFFVGDADRESVDYITTIKPIAFLMTDISSVFDVTGSVYSIEFVSITNGAAKLPQYVTGADRTSLVLDSSLKKSLSILEGKINDHYKIHFDKLKTTADESGQPLVGRKVKYEIILDPKYSEYTIDQDPEYLKNIGLQDEAGILNFGQKPSIESAIFDILKRSKQYGDDAVGKNTEKNKERGKKYLPKITSTIDSSKTEYKIIYKIIKTEVPTSTIERIYDNDADFVSEGNAIVFDYFFSGKNTDILEFNIQMQMGLMFFQTITTADSTLSSQNETGKTEKTGSGNSPNVRVNNPSKGPRINTPISFSTIVKRPKDKNTNFPLASTDFQSLLARHAAMEMLDAKIKIIGNPALLNNMAQLPSDVIDEPNFVPQDNDVFREWTTSPGLVKVNIFMPSDDNDTDYSTKFWYDGWYYVVEVEHIFSGGAFTQVIEMLSLPLEQYITKEDEEQKKADKSEKGST